MDNCEGNMNDLPSLAEAERLHLLIEECGEVIQAATKVLRHGYDSVHPFITDSLDNTGYFEFELGDLSAIIGIMIRSGDISGLEITKHQEDKIHRLPKWTHHQ